MDPKPSVCRKSFPLLLLSSLPTPFPSCRLENSGLFFHFLLPVYFCGTILEQWPTMLLTLKFSALSQNSATLQPVVYVWRREFSLWGTHFLGVSSAVGKSCLRFQAEECTGTGGGLCSRKPYNRSPMVRQRRELHSETYFLMDRYKKCTIRGAWLPRDWNLLLVTLFGGRGSGDILTTFHHWLMPFPLRSTGFHESRHGIDKFLIKLL